MKKRFLAIGVLGAVAIMMASCGNAKKETTAPETTTTAEEATEEVVEDEESEADETADEDDSLNIEFGDFEKMQELTNNMADGTLTDQTVYIDGTVNDVDGFAITEADPEDPESYAGVMFVLEDVEDDAYPADGERIIIEGVVTEGEDGIYYVDVLDGNWSVYEEDAETTDVDDDVETDEDVEVDENEDTDAVETDEDDVVETVEETTAEVEDN